MTTTAAAIYAYILAYKTQHDGNSPTVRQISAECHVAISVVHYHLRRLQEAKLIALPESGSARHISVIGGSYQPPSGGMA